MFNVGDVVEFRITGAKVMVLQVNTYKPIESDGKETTFYTIRLPTYNKATDILGIELKAIDDKKE